MIKRWAVLVCLILNLGIFVKGGFSEEKKPIKLEEIVVTAQRRETPVKHLSDSITVIKGTDIRLKEQTDLFSVMRDVPGLSFKRCGGPGQWTYVRMRGGRNRHIKVMINGMDISDPSFWGQSFSDWWSFIDTEDIERIEIVRGPQSSLYGSGAISGVINIIPKRGRGRPKFYVKSYGGSMDIRRVSAGINGEFKGFGYNVSYAYEKGGGVFKHDEFRNHTLSGRFDYPLTDSLNLDLTVRYTDAWRNFAQWDYGSFRAYDDPHAYRNDYIFFSNFKATHRVTPWWDYKVAFAFTHYKKNYDDQDDGQLAPGVFDSWFKGTYKGEKEHFLIQHNFHIAEIDTVSIGYEYENDHGESEYISSWGHKEGDKTFHNKSIFINNQILLFNRTLSITAGGRFDDHSTFGWHGTYKFGVAYLIEKDWFFFKIRGNYATGYKAPSLAQLYDARYGNPDLDPEESESYDAGFDLSLFQDKIRYYFTYFHNDFDDLISFDYATWRYKNFESAESYGIETGASFSPIPNLTVSVNYTYTEGEEGRYDDLSITPEDELEVNISYFAFHGRFRLSTDIYYVGERLAYDHTHEIDDYTRVDISSSYKIHKNLECWFKLQNLFDEDYEEAAGYPSPGISAWGGIRISFEEIL